MLTKDEILANMKKICAHNGFEETENIAKIANAKAMILGEKWIRCPCDPDNAERFCISKLCKSDIERDGICHCQCYKKKS